MSDKLVIRNDGTTVRVWLGGLLLFEVSLSDWARALSGGIRP